MAHKNISKKIKYVFVSIIFILVVIILIIFIRNRIFLGSIRHPLSPQKTDATISIQNFQHVANKNGREEWSLNAKSANLYSSQNKAELTEISASFFLKDNNTISLTADKGILNTKTNNMTVTGHIIVKFSDYVMTTENLNYLHNSHIISSNTPIDITSDSMSLRAKTMKYNLLTDIIICSGNVKGTFTKILE